MAEPYDVVIAGSGLGGSTLAAILARRGLSVLLLEARSHPRFVIGESVVPEFGARARLLAERYELPELAFLSNFQLVRHHVGSNSGIKRSFTFCFHGEGEEHRGADTRQFPTLAPPLGPDTHFYRPDLDSWLTTLAVRCGAEYRERTPVDEVETDAHGVRVHAGDRRFAARFFVDGRGARSPLARPDSGASFRTDSRTIFTHMTGVARLADARRGERTGVPTPPDQGTIHHYFDGGWFWIIPFDNHREATNPVCSVGLTLDRRAHPDNDTPAEEEFAAFVRRFPTVARHLEGARPLRGWVKTGAIQHAAERVAGARWWLLPHTASFVDPLFSGGMTLTLAGVDEIAGAILAAPRGAGFDAAGADEAARDQREQLDKLVHGAYLAFGDPALFNAWYRIWAVANFHASAGLVALHFRFLKTGARALLDQVGQAPYHRILAMGQPRVRALLDEGYGIVVAEGTAAARTDALFALLARQDWIPAPFRIADRDHRHVGSFTVFRLLQLMRWGKRHAPEEMRTVYYDIGPRFFWELTRTLALEAARGVGSLFRVAFDAHYSRNRS